MNTLTGDNWTVYHGDCRDGLALLPAGSVHCVVTSPPYWGGIRDYKIPAVVWGGDPECQHEFSDVALNRGGTNRRKNAEHQGLHGYANDQISDTDLQGTCTRCGAWRGCYGNEPTVQLYVEHTLEIFDLMGRVLRDDGVIFWNLGDTYADDKKWSGRTGGKHVADLHGEPVARQRRSAGVESGNKSLVPFRVAIALQDAGWVIRQDIVWRKASPMPESVDGTRWERCRVKVATKDTSEQQDGRGGNGKGFRGHSGSTFYHETKWKPCPGCRKCEPNGGYVLRRGKGRPSTGHEFILMVTKPGRYFWDGVACQEPTTGNANSRGSVVNPKCVNGTAGQERQNASFSAAVNEVVETRNPRSVWSIDWTPQDAEFLLSILNQQGESVWSFSNEPFKGQHFAAFPTEMPWKCIQAATSPVGCCPECGAQWAPVVEKVRVPTRPGTDSKVWKQDVADGLADGQRSTASPNRDPERHIVLKRASGYRPTCECEAGESEPCTVLDPFTGSGSTLQVAIHTDRRFVGFEMADHYLSLIQERAATPWVPKALRKQRNGKRRKSHRSQLSLSFPGEPQS